MPPDPTSVRVLIPRTRRLLEGPAAASGNASGSSSFTDPQVEALVADAIADVILYSGGFFGHELEVTERDEVYGAPIGWKTAEELTEPEGTLVMTQAALNYFFVQVKDMKVQESISREGEAWSYQLSANALTEWLRYLRAERDKAIAEIAKSGAALESYESFILVRDRWTSHYIEPWVTGAGLGGMETDPRFG